MSNIITLYHGSKSGIHGSIKPSSREQCDFGRGFYMGTEKRQPLILICTRENAQLYTIEFDMSDLKVLELQPGIEWALLVAYFRGAMEIIKGSEIYNNYRDIAQQTCDVIKGPIANDRIYNVLERFFEGLITDIQLVSSLSALKLGTQYTAKTQEACDRVTIMSVEPLSDDQRKKLMNQSEQMRLEGVRLANEICRANRRAHGRYYDEIIGG